MDQEQDIYTNITSFYREFSKTKTVSPKDVWRLSGESTVEER